jgi:hypothetical protein
MFSEMAKRFLTLFVEAFKTNAKFLFFNFPNPSFLLQAIREIVYYDNRLFKLNKQEQAISR